jgi:uncharacterized membrane protein YjgN (DUF898 family)
MTNAGNGKYVKSFIGVILLSIITLGIYLWVYLFKVLRHLQDGVSYQGDDFTPAKARPMLGWLVFLAYAVPIGFIVFLAPQMGRELEYAARVQQSGMWGRFASPPQASIGDQILAHILPVAMAAITLGINVIMIRVISVSQERIGIKPFDKTVAWILLAVGAVLQVISEVNFAIVLASWICGLVLLYIIVSQSNRCFERT